MADHQQHGRIFMAPFSADSTTTNLGSSNFQSLSEFNLIEDIKQAAEDGHVDNLRAKMCRKHHGHALEAAEEAGTLMRLLAHFQLPIAGYPSVAEALLPEALDIFSGDHQALESDSDDEQCTLRSNATELDDSLVHFGKRKSRRPRWHWAQPSREASVLANFLSVPSEAAEKAMEGAVEHMVVFQSQYQYKAVKDHQATAFPSGMPFLYLHRLIPAIGAIAIEYDRRKHEVKLPDIDVPLKTSREYAVSLTGFSRKAARIPDKAAIFTYIYQGEGFETGGFLYLDRCARPLAVNQISFEEKEHVFGFGEGIPFPDEAVAFIGTRGDHVAPVDVPSLLNKGVSKYFWIGPNETLPGFNPGPVGGFAYIIGGGRSMFFRILSAGRIKHGLVKYSSECIGSAPEDCVFPDALPTLFLTRVWACARKRSKIFYDRASQVIRLEDGLVAKVSEEYPITMDNADRRAALIPLQADKFAYIYENEAFESGGFLYLDTSADDNVMPIAINVACFKRTAHAIAFTKGVHFDVGAEEEQLFMEMPESYFRRCGAIKYKWVGPLQKVGDVATGPTGGFAYIFDDRTKNRFYAILTIAEVATRANISHGMNLDVLPVKAQSREIEQKVMRTSEGSANFSRVRVRVARLKVPDARHPVLLHALAFTPRCEALDTIAAKAISQHSFHWAGGWVALDIALELVSLAAMMFATGSIRDDNFHAGGSSQDHGRGKLLIAFAVIVFVFVKDLMQEVLITAGYFRWGWSSELLNSQRLAKYIHEVGVCSLVVFLGFAIAGNYRFHFLVRPILAMVGGMKWVRVLYFFRGFQTWNLGYRILPILAALSEVWDFILIMLFFLSAVVQASFALSPSTTSINSLIFGTYRLTFLGDFDTDADIFFKDEAAPEGLPNWEGYQQAAFMVASFIVAVAMTNIFIGVMSSAYDYYAEKVGELFIRSRCIIGMEYCLRNESVTLLVYACAACFCRCCGCFRCCGCCRRRAQDTAFSEDSDDDDERNVEERLWFCYQDDDTAFVNNTLRGSMRDVQTNLTKKLEELGQMVNKVTQKQQEEEEVIEHISPRPGSSRCDNRPSRVKHKEPWNILRNRLTRPRPEPPERNLRSTGKTGAEVGNSGSLSPSLEIIEQNVLIVEPSQLLLPGETERACSAGTEVPTLSAAGSAEFE